MAFTVATLLEKCSKSNRISQILKKIACGGQFSILSSELNGFHSCYIAGKVLQIRPNIENPQKKSPAAGSSGFFKQISKKNSKKFNFFQKFQMKKRSKKIYLTV
jgi:hypothetical protein